MAFEDITDPNWPRKISSTETSKRVSKTRKTWKIENNCNERSRNILQSLIIQFVFLLHGKHFKMFQAVISARTPKLHLSSQIMDSANLELIALQVVHQSPCWNQDGGKSMRMPGG